MGATLAGYRLAVLGGDERQIILTQSLLEKGAKVKVLGFPKRSELEGSHFCDNINEAISDVEAIILPMPGTDLEGNIITLGNDRIKITEEIFKKIPSNVPIYLGVAKPFLRDWAKKHTKKLVEIANLDEVAILNSIPTAEGAIQMAMEHSPITIQGSNSVVIGFGRCGITLARMVSALGARTTVLARKPKDLARIKEMGLKSAEYSEIKTILAQAEIIFNTIPVQILDSDTLAYTNKDAIIIDIASAPGGTDFDFAKKIGIKAFLAPSLPGRVAPKTAGLILAEVLPNHIIKEISLSQKKEAGGKAL